MNYLIFATKNAADAAQTKITKTHVLRDGVTSAWAVPMQRITDNKLFFLKPEDRYMTGVSSYTEEEFSSSWLPAPIVY